MQTIIIEGVPISKHRPRFARIGKGVRTYSDQGDDVCIVRDEAKGQVETKLTCPLSVFCVFKMPRPKSHFGTGKNANILKKNAPHYHTTKPDIDNLVKFYLDCLNGIAWEDDKQIIYIQATKTYSEEPLTSVRIQEHGVQL